MILPLLGVAGSCDGAPSSPTSTDGGTSTNATTTASDSSASSQSAGSTGDTVGTSPTNSAPSNTTSADTTGSVSKGAESQGSSSETSGGESPRSQGCGLAVADTGSFVESFVESGGLSRGFFVRLPADYDPDTAYPVVFGWHGSVSQGTRSAGLIGVTGIQSQFGDAAIAVGPSGGDTEFTWSEDGFSVSDATVDFFDQIAADLESNYCVDTSRIFTMGFSAGASVSNQLACRRGGQIRATAAIAGLAPIQPCLDDPVAAWFLHGAQDGAVPFDHGLQARDRLLAANDCDEESEPTQDEGCISYLGCSSGYPVIWCPHEGGHDLPGGAYGQIWGFFSQFL